MEPPEENFIPGIYNYCDRWCERCLYTDRCRVFVMEKEFTETYEAEQHHKKSREENRKFYKDLPKDSEGSSSVALKGIEKSLGAWNIFYQYMEEERTAIAPLITLLFLLRAGLLKTFPGAATFRWPPKDQEPE